MVFPDRICRSLVVFCAAVLTSIVTSVPVRGDDPPIGEIISTGAAPFTETLDDMIARDAANAAAPPGESAGVQFSDRPIVPRFQGDPPPDSETPPEAPGDSPPQSGPAQLNPSLRLAPPTIGTSFTGLTLQDQLDAFMGAGFSPPATMGAIGPNHFVEMLTGSVAVYTRTGTRLSHVSSNSFFAVSSEGINYPRNGTFDPRILFDRRSNRWFACTLERGDRASNNQLLFVVSRTSDPTGTFDKYVIPIGEPIDGAISHFTLYPTMGVDDNGVYFGVSILPVPVGDIFAKIAATPKAPLIAMSPSLGTVTQFSDITDVFSTPQPAHNHDMVPANGLAWFVAASNVALGNIHYRTLMWVAGAPVLSSGSILNTADYGDPSLLDAPANGSAVPIDTGDDRMQTAVIRNNRLWTCRTVGLSAAGGASPVTRTGVEWYELNVSAAPAPLVQQGRVFDSAVSDPRFYYCPSIMVSGQGHASMGFSGSKSTERVGAYACGRVATDTAGTMSPVTTVKSGVAAYQILDGLNRNRWGDYSYTSLDPNDDMSIWTVQEFAAATDIWGTWIAQLRAPPPATPVACSPSALGDVALSTNIVVTGSSTAGAGFFDPGPGFSNRIAVTINGSDLVINSVTVDSPTQLTLNVTVPATPLFGNFTVTVTNPDGQSVTSATGILAVQCEAVSLSITKQPIDHLSCGGDTITFAVTAVSSTPRTYQWRKNGEPINSATEASYSIEESDIDDAGQYDVVITSDCSQVTSRAASLIVIHPVIVGNPGELTVKTCTLITFSVVLEGSNMLSYQWRKDGEPLANSDRFEGVQALTLSIGPVAREDAGVYDVVVETDCGAKISNQAILVVQGNTNPEDCPQTSAQGLEEVCAMCGPNMSLSLTLTIAGWCMWRRHRRLPSSRP